MRGRPLGFAGFNLAPHGPGPEEQTERVAKELLPAVRANV